MKNYTSFYGGEKKSFYGSFIQNIGEERVLKRGPSQIVSFNAEKSVQLLSLIADFYPIQSGNGQPSPENIRPISGRTFADVCISPTLDAGDGKIYHVIFPTQVGTAYGGTIDMINKTLTINYLYKIFTGQEDWEIYFPPRAAQYYRLVLGEHGSVINDSGICSHFPQKLITSSQSSIEDGQRIVNSSAIPYAIICIRYVEKQKTVDEFKDWLREQYNAGTPVQVAYKISNPTVYNIDIDSVTLYPNDNNIWIENGDITIQYKINKNIYDNTANGNPCVLNKSINISITNLLLNISPVQDLNGYDAPWSKGARNRLDASAVTSNNQYIRASTGIVTKPASNSVKWRSTDYIPVSPGETLFFGEIGAVATVAGTSFYDSTKVFLSGFSASQLMEAENVWTVPKNAAYMRHSFRIDSTYNVDWETTVYIVLDSNQHVWSPYSNSCPITGWTGAKVMRCGKNLLTSAKTEYTVNANYRYRNGVVPKGCTAVMSFYDKDTSVDISGIYIGFGSTIPNSGSPSHVRWVLYKGVVQPNRINTSGFDGVTLCENVLIYPNTEDVFNRLFARYDIQVELGTAATDYEPYTSETYSVEFPTEAGTVYGGTLDVTRGVLTVDRAMVDAGTLKWSYWISNRFYAVINGKTATAIDSVICSCYKTVSNARSEGIYNQMYDAQKTNVYITDSKYSHDAQGAIALKTDLDGQQIVYELASPITYQLTPTQINALDKLTILTTDVDNITTTYKAKNK